MYEVNINRENEYTHRNIWINRCNDNHFSHLSTDFHLVPFADEINVWGNGIAVPTPPYNEANNYETRRK